jgi:hypothetical protein
VHSALSANVATISTNLSALSTRHSALSDSLTSVASIASAAASAAAAVSANHTSLVSDVGRISTNVSAMSTRVDTVSAAVVTVSASLTSVASIASAAASAAAAVSANHTSLVSDVGRISTNASAMSTRIDTVSAAVVTVSASLTSVASIASAAASAAAAVSAAHTSLASDVGRLSTVVSALNAGTGSVTSTELSIAAGGILSLQNVDSVTVSAGAPVYMFTSANTFKRGNASATSAKHIVGLVVDGSVAVSAIGRVQTQGQVTLTTGQWDSITGGSGGLTVGSTYYLDSSNGKLTATAPSVTIRRPIGIAVSSTVLFLHSAQEWDALSDAVSVGTATADALSNAISVVSAAVVTVSASLTSVASIASAAYSAAAAASAAAATVSANVTSLASDVGRISQLVSAVGTTGQLMVVAGNQAAFSAATKISGLSASLANSVYQLEGMVAFSCSGAASIAFGFSTSAAAFGLFVGMWQIMISASSGVSADTNLRVGTFNTQNTTQGTAIGTTGVVRFATVKALIRVTTPGSIQMKGTALTGGPMTIMQGSYLNVFKIG